MEKEIKLPVTYRASILVFLGSFLFLFWLVVPDLYKFIYLLFNSKFYIIFFILLLKPLAFTPIVLIMWTVKLEVDENGFEFSGLFLAGKKRYIRWETITKVTAGIGAMPFIDIHFQDMNSYTPLHIPLLYFSHKSIDGFIKILFLKAPQVELGYGVDEFRKKFIKEANE